MWYTKTSIRLYINYISIKKEYLHSQSFALEENYQLKGRYSLTLVKLKKNGKLETYVTYSESMPTFIHLKKCSKDELAKEVHDT